MPVALGAWTALSTNCHNVATGGSGLCRRVDDVNELVQRLSNTAQVYLPDSDMFNEATSRWSVLDVPEINVVVVPGVENDVAETVKYANSKNVSYLAVNGGHGSISSIGRFQGGIEIWMTPQLSGVEIADDGNTATIGAGTLIKNITESLWAAGKQSVTAGCECVSLVGPGLGGGHGFLQGRHGLVSDQFVSMNIVLADGTLHTVNATSNPDLWWALRGAGHNFGIVTSVTTKIYDIQHSDWAFESFTFTGDQLESLYDAINENILMNGTQPVDLINFSLFSNRPTIDATRPVITMYLIQEGATAVNTTYTQPFHDLGPIATSATSGTYMDLATWTGFSNTAGPCQKAGFVNARFPIHIQTYNITAQRQAFELFAASTQETPALNQSVLLFEGFSLQGVKAEPAESSAYAFRNDNILASQLLRYTPGNSSDNLNAKAKSMGNGIRGILHEGSGQSEMHVYVNYAFGDETVRNWYGFEQWRQDKLLALKQRYDPGGKFSFYAPIA